MTNKNISGLTAATTPLAGTELVPLWDGTATKKTTVKDFHKLNQPMFSAYATAAQTVATTSATKLTLDAEEFDTNNNFDITTSRFTPTVAGYYQFSCSVFWNSASGSGLLSTILAKNGATYKAGYGVWSILGYAAANVDALVYMNGTTDYMEVNVIQYTGASQTTSGGASAVFLTGALVKYA